MCEWIEVQAQLVEVFEDAGLNVAVGLRPGNKGLVLRSQDERVDMSNIGQVVAWSYPYE